MTNKLIVVMMSLCFFVMFCIHLRTVLELRDLRSRTCEVAAQCPLPPQFQIDKDNQCVWVRTAGNTMVCWPLPTEPDQ